MIEREGVIKYQLAFSSRALDICADSLNALNDCRKHLIDWKMLGQDALRYDGLGFGNLSFRHPAQKESFFISGSQTGHLPTLTSQDLALVNASDVDRNYLEASGNTRPSSEAMTHAVIYQIDDEYKAVAHVHCPDIWQMSDALCIASTAPDIPYGTPEMAKAVVQLVNLLRDSGREVLFVMKGHQDGVVAAGVSFHACMSLLADAQQHARAIRDGGC